ncbi:MAG: restriction endonuclease [Opitutaceae bacterium]|nr:restriction endonuclease [Opitutaceae bacterium]
MRAKAEGLIVQARRDFHAALLAGPLTVSANGVPAIADAANKKSIRLAQALVEGVGAAKTKAKVAGQQSGDEFEDAVLVFLRATFLALPHLRPGNWTVEKGGGQVSRFEQLAHLAELARFLGEHPGLKAAMPVEYFITPDVVVSRAPEPDEVINHPRVIADASTAVHSPLRRQNNPLPLLHATISCKWTIRSDRVQNTRTEAQNLIRNRNGRVPHIVAVTAEPLPSRIGAIAQGTADLDCVYHFALPELIAAHTSLGYDEDDFLKSLVDAKRLRDISDLPLDLAI